ncbi:MAG: DUF1156 domain-containing protein [Desulfatirhabdiaceae bacterium]
MNICDGRILKPDYKPNGLSNMTRRLIEQWLPIAELSEESVRERRSMTTLPPIYYLHVWWARRPLVACRAAILASMLTGRFFCMRWEFMVIRLLPK